MKLPFFAVTVALVALSSTWAGTFESEIQPTKQNDFPLAFEIHSKQLSSGDTQFIVRISNRSLKSEAFSSRAQGPDAAFLETFEFNKLLGPGVYGTEQKILRPLPLVRNKNDITCVFSVTKNELETPHLAFVLSVGTATIVNGKLTEWPDSDLYYAKL
jgi:hypothetical protein